MSIELKIKQITIAAEARGIKINENRLKRKLRKLAGLGKKPGRYEHAFWSLRRHRLDHVRPEARAIHLAYNFLKGRAYFEVEPISHLHLRTDTFDAAWDALMKRARYHVERHLEPGKKNSGLDEFAKWEEDGKRYAHSKDMQLPARKAARKGSLEAKAARLAAWKIKNQAA